ncbi:MAG TPA: DUF1552 domain-containing protein [Gemmataceae bacterium]|nr:DUF1552 domain-containing protein [Gemmataceae bacterium]
MGKSLLISRRTALKGLGACIALPWLEAMLPRTAFGAAAATTAPLRMAFLYVPNGKNMAMWTPKDEGAAYELTPTLEPLKEFKDDFLVLTGLTADKARPHGDGPGDHARAMSAWLTGKQPRKTDGADIRIGVSADQVAAQAVGSATRFASLEIGCEGGKNAGNCDSGYSCAYSANLSWRGESTPMSKEINPKLVFDRLFSTAAKGDGDAARRDRSRQSVLDYVAEDAKALQSTLGATDQRKLDEYLTGVRELEQRIAKAPPAAEVGENKMDRPTGIPRDYKEHNRLMADLLALAFQADLTRIATFVFANDGSNRSYKGDLDFGEGHHDLSHHQGDKEKLAKIAKINAFHISHLAYLLGKLKAVQEGDRTLLDNCMICYGSGISDGNRHNHDDLPILLAGHGGGTIKPGRHIRFPRETPLTNLYVSMLDRMGVKVDSFGDSKGHLDGLEG